MKTNGKEKMKKLSIERRVNIIESILAYMLEGGSIKDLKKHKKILKRISLVDILKYAKLYEFNYDAYSISEKSNYDSKVSLLESITHNIIIER